jgi:hypothetical protein
MFVIAKKKSRSFGKKNHRLEIGVKNLWKICRLVYGFCFFVTSTSGFNTSIVRHSGIRGAADEAMLNLVLNTSKTSPIIYSVIFYSTLCDK